MKFTRLVVALWLLCLLLIPAAVQRAGAQGTKALLLENKGSDHKTFLGCLNCTDTSDNSVCNDVGKYGSDVAENQHLPNDVGKFGSDVSPLSPVNDVSTDAPN